MKGTEITFSVHESPEGGFEAQALGYPIFTHADSAGELEEMVRDAVQCHFDTVDMPAKIRLQVFPRAAVHSGRTATLGKSVAIRGELSGSEDLVVNGVVEGSISLAGRAVTVGPEARIVANIDARNVVLFGTMNGDIRAYNVELRKTASLTGNVMTARITIEDGAFFKGTIDIKRSANDPETEVYPTITEEVINV